jgi:hypothetical protein
MKVAVGGGSVAAGVFVGSGLGVSVTAIVDVAAVVGVVAATSVAVGRPGNTRVLVGVGVVPGSPGRHWTASNPVRTTRASRKTSLLRLNTVR